MKKPSSDPRYDVLQADFVAELRPGGSLPDSALPEIAFAGRSNVGKSTLLNALAQRHSLARTSRTPGCTRGIISFDLTVRAYGQFRLVDLPGYGFAERSHAERRAWAPMIESYLQNRESLKGVVVLVDVRRGPEAEEETLVGFLARVGLPWALGATKIDKLTKAEKGSALASLRGYAKTLQAPVVGLSGETGEGREALLKVLQHWLGPKGEVLEPGVAQSSALE